MREIFPELVPHPASGLHYAFSFPDVPAFRELFESYRAASKNLPWMSAVPAAETLRWAEESPVAGRGRLLVILWGAASLEGGKLPGKGALVAVRFTETYARPEDTTPDQARWFAEFSARRSEYDLVVVHSPSVYAGIAPGVRRAVLSPIGYQADVMGRPDWEKPKDWDAAGYGTPVGRRTWLMPRVREHLGKRYRDVTGNFGRERKLLLDQARAILYVNHSRAAAFGTSRLWQAVASSAALLIGRCDAWPAVEGRHYVALPWAEEGEVGAYLGALEEALGRDDLAAIARRTHEELSRYTVRRCLEDFIVPGTVGMV